MAQSLAMYKAHALSQSQTRSCLVVEPVGLGTNSPAVGLLDVSVYNVSLPAQAAAVMACAVAAFPDATEFSVAGFFLGRARGLAVAWRGVLVS
jgi:hypothetical protein